jgi:hypothetical protein
MPKTDSSGVPANVAAAAASRVARRDSALLFASLAFLAGDARRQLSLPSTLPVPPDLGEPKVLDEVLHRTPLSRKSWYRLCAEGAWSVGRLNRELTDMASLVVNEHRIPPDVLQVLGRAQRMTPESVVVALALHSAHPVPDGPIAEYVRQDSAVRTATLIELAADIVMKAGLGSTHQGLERLEQYHRWLEALASAHTSDVLGIPGITNSERRVAGLLAGLKSLVTPPESAVRDDAGLWAEGVVDALIQRNELRLCRDFVKAQGFDSPDRTVLNPLEYFAERVAVRILAGPASDPATKQARDMGRRVAQELQDREEQGDLPPQNAFLRRRAAAIRYYLLGDWRRALTEAVASGLNLVRAEVEREYGFPILAVIAHEAATKIDDLREPYTASFLHREIARGRGPFLDGPVREMGEELVESGTVDELAQALNDIVPQAQVDALDAAVWELTIARAFNVSAGSYGLNDMLTLADDLRARAARIDGAATQLALLATES